MGTLTISDVCDMLRLSHVPGTTAAAAAIAEFTIAAWRGFVGADGGAAASGSNMTRNSTFTAELAEWRADHPEQVAEEDEDEEDEEEEEEDGEAAGSDGARPASEGAVSGRAAARRASVGIMMEEEDEEGAGVDGGEGGGAAPAGAARRRRRGSALHAQPITTRRRRDARPPDAAPTPRPILRRMVSVHPEDDLLSVCRRLHRHGIHHLPVYDPEQTLIVAVLNHKNLLMQIADKFSDPRDIFSIPLVDLGIGCYDDVIVVPETASVVSVLHVLAERRVSALPVVSADTGAVIDVYSKDDVAFLANDPTLMVLDAPIGDVRRAQIAMTGIVAPLLTIAKGDTLKRALELLIAAQGRADRLVCVDEARRVTGIVSVSDIFDFFGNLASA